MKTFEFKKSKLHLFVIKTETLIGISLKIGSWKKYFMSTTNYREKLRRKITKVKNALVYLIPWPVYYECNSMDCDCVQSRTAHRFLCGFMAMETIKTSYEAAEGPTSWYRMTKKDFKSFEPERRDLIGEAFDNGHPHVVYR